MQQTGLKTSSEQDTSRQASLTDAALWTCDPETYEGSPSATSSPESESGHTRFAEQVGEMIAVYGLDRVLANLSARQAKALGLMTSGISGPTGSTSSSSASLRSSLESRLRARTDSLGSTLFTLTWKQRATPSGLLISALRASARRTSDNDCTSWGTPMANDKLRSEAFSRGRNLNLAEGAMLASWPTAAARDWKGATHERWGENARPLNEVAKLAFWHSPAASDGNGGKRPHPDTSMTGRHPSGRKVNMGLASQVHIGVTHERWGENARPLNEVAKLAHWATPTTEANTHCYGPDKTIQMKTYGQARLADWTDTWPAGTKANLEGLNLASGREPTGSPAAMASGGQLNPSHSRWLMGLPPVWDECAPIMPRRLKKR